MSADTDTGDTGRCDVCRNYDNLDRIPLVRGRGSPESVDLKACEVCRNALRRYFDTDP